MYIRDMDVSVTDLRANLAAHLQEVRHGSEVVITDRGEPIAKLVPFGAGALLDDLVARGIVTRRKSPRVPSASIRTVKSKSDITDLPRSEWR